MKIVVVSLFLLLTGSLFGYGNYLESQKDNYVNNIKKNSDNITILYDIMKLWDINNYFDDNPFKETIKNLKTKNKILNSYLDIYRNRVDKKYKIGYAGNYYIIGPFNNQGKSGFTKSYLPESDFSLNKQYEGKNQKVKWKTIKNYEKSFINFKNFLNPKVDALGYALFFVKIKKSGKYQIRFATNNQYELFLDKKSVLKSEFNDSLYYDKNIIDVYLKRGIHTILVKLDNKYNTWGIYLRVLDKNGKFNKKNIEFVLADKYPSKYSKSKILSKNSDLIKQLEKIKNKNYKYYIKRAVLEKYFIPYDKKSKPYPYEQYLAKAIKLAKTDSEKGEAYYNAYFYNSNKVDAIDYLNKAVEYNYFSAVLSKIERDIAINKLYEVKDLINKAEKTDKYDYKLLFLMNSYYQFLGINYLNRVIKKYQESKRISGFFEFKIDKLKFSSLKVLINIYEKNQKKHFFSIDDTKDLLSYYLEDLNFKKYESLLNEKLKNDYLSFDYNSLKITYLFSRQMYSELLDLFEKRKELLDDSPKLVRIIAKTYQLLRDKKNSIKYYNKYLELTPNDTKIKEYLSFVNTSKKELWAKKYIEKLEKEDIKYSDYKPGNKPVEKLYEHVIVKVNNDFSFNLYRKAAVAINNSESVRRFKFIPMYYLPNNERVSNSYVKIIKKSGETEEITDYRDRYYRSKSNGAFTNYSLRGYYLPNLEKGDIIEYSYYLKNNNIYEDPFYAAVYNLNSLIPAKRATFTFITDNKKLNFNLTPKTENGNEYFFEFKDLKEVKKEPSSTGYSSNYKFLSVSSLSSWQELVDWYKGLLYKQDILPQNVKDELHKGVDKLSSPEEKVKWVHNYLFEHTHYVGIELGLNAYKPYSATEVLERKYGDCKDKANLFNSLLKEVGIKSEIVLLRTNTLGQITSQIPANPKYFNHAISYIPDLNLFVDLTAEKNGLFDLPFTDQEATGIIIRNNEKLIQLPSVESKEIINIAGNKEKNNLRAKITFILKNSLGSTLRYGLENKELRKNYLQKLLKPVFSSFEINTFSVNNFDDINKDLIIEVNVVVKDFFAKKRLYNSVFIKKSLENMGLLNKRTEGYKKLKMSVEENIVIKGINIKQMYKNKDFNIENDIFSYISKIDQKDNKEIIIKNKISWKKFSINVADYESFKNGINEITKFMKNNIVYLNGDK